MDFSRATLPNSNLFGYTMGLPSTIPTVIPTPAEIILSATVSGFIQGNTPISPSVFLQKPNIDISVLPSSSKTSSSSQPSGNAVTNIASIAKQEPTSSNSEPATPMIFERRSVPACAICGADSTGIHFGVDACAACSAFFRRTVVLSKEYGCNKDGNCVVLKDGSAGQKCRSCRFAKCLRVGMDRNSVQHRRDAIGKYSSGVKREYSPMPGDPKSLSPPPKISRESNNMLEELVEKYKVMMQRRKLFYASKCLAQMFDDEPELCQEVVELKSITECMYQLWKIEPRLAAEYINSNRFLSLLSPTEKVKLYKNFVILRQAVEEPFLTWKHGGLDKKWWIMPNRVYIDFAAAERYFETGVMAGLNLDITSARNLFMPSFSHAMTTVGELMRRIDISELEMIALYGVVLFDPTIPNLSDDTRQLMHKLRNQLLQDMFNYYEGDDSNEEPEVRIGNLLMILGAIKVHAMRTSENMHMMRIFDLIPRDKIFEEMVSGPNDINME